MTAARRGKRRHDFSAVGAFVAVAERGSFSRAAAELGISPSTLSETIGRLESELGVRLLNRTTRSVALTEPGRRLLSEAKPALATLESAARRLRDEGARPAGVVRIHAPRSAVETYLEPVLGEMAASYPDVHLDITVGSEVVDIVAAGYDVGIRLEERLEQDVVAVKLGGSYRQLAFAAPEYLARRGTPRTPDDLSAHRCINWRQAGEPAVYAWEFHRAGKWFSRRVDGPLTVSDRSLAVSAALQGVGIGFWVEPPLRPHFASGRLVPLLEEWSAPFPGFSLFYPKQRVTPPAVKALVTVLRRRSRAGT